MHVHNQSKFKIDYSPQFSIILAKNHSESLRPATGSIGSQWSVFEGNVSYFQFLIIWWALLNVFFDSRSIRKVKNSNPNLKRMIVRCFFNRKKFFLRFILLYEISFQKFDYWIISKLDDQSENFKVTFIKIKCSEYLLCDKSWGIFVCGPLNVFLGVSLDLYSAIIFWQ